MQPSYSSAAVFDCGSHLFKAGMSGDDAPTTTFQTIIGRQKRIMVGMHKDTYIGQQIQSNNRDNLNLSYPINRGIVYNWDDMTKILHHCYYDQLKITPSEHPCLLTEPTNNPKYSRQRMIEMMFQTFNVPAFYSINPTLLSLYSLGKTSGIVLNCGDGYTQAFSIYQGQPISKSYKVSEFGGMDLTDYMRILLVYLGCNLSTSSYQWSYQTQTIRQFKQKYAYVALDFDAQIKNSSNNISKIYKLPDGKTVSVQKERFICGQALFKPMLMGKQFPGLHQMIHQSISKCDEDLKTILYQNIVLVGGSTLLPGLPQRISKEVTHLAPYTMKVKVFAPAQRNFLPWIGGSILSSLSTFQQKWIRKSQYEQYGPQGIHMKDPFDIK